MGNRPRRPDPKRRATALLPGAAVFIKAIAGERAQHAPAADQAGEGSAARPALSRSEEAARVTGDRRTSAHSGSCACPHMAGLHFVMRCRMLSG
jgi:hypothetical protein